MPNFDQHPAGNFVWFELSTTDQSAADAVLLVAPRLGVPRTCPWAPDMIYTMFRLNGRDTAGAYTMKAEERQLGIPPNWLIYISVDNADATVATVLEHGGNPMSPAFDVPNVGRMAVIQDPAGAVFAIFQPGHHNGVRHLRRAWRLLLGRSPDPRPRPRRKILRLRLRLGIHPRQRQ